MTLEPVHVSPPPKRFARLILASAALVQLFLFATTIKGDLLALGSSQGWSRPQFTGSSLCGLDTHGYYAWLRSLLLDGDWDFTNEYRFYQRYWSDGEALNKDRTATGRPANHWSVGPALVWSTAVIPVHLILTATGVAGEEPRGYSAPYHLAVGVVTFALSLATLLFLYKIARVFVSPIPAAAAAGMVILGTPLVAYGTVSLGMAHGPAAAALAGYVHVWLRTFGGTRPRALVQCWVLARDRLPHALAVGDIRDTARAGDGLAGTAGPGPRGRFLALAGLAAVAAALAFLPQMAAWRVVYGRPILNPHPTTPAWLTPNFWRVLVSPDQSLFYWTPVTLLGVIGLFGAAVKPGFAGDRSRSLVAASRPGGTGSVPSRILLVGVAIQIYAMAAVTDRGVCLGYSFGFRFLTEACVILVVGLAVLLQSAARRWPTLLAVACGTAIGWNLLLLGVYNRCITGAENGPAAMAAAVLRYIIRRPTEACLLIALATGLTLHFLRGFRSSATDPAAAQAGSAGWRGWSGVIAPLVRGFRRNSTR